MKRKNLLRNLDPSKPDWTKPVKEVARSLKVSLQTAYRLRDSYRRGKPQAAAGNRIDPQAELAWIIDTLKRCHRVRRDAEKAFGPALKAWRKKSRLTQIDLASALLGSDNRASAISEWEQSERGPSEETLNRMTQYLETLEP